MQVLDSARVQFKRISMVNEAAKNKPKNFLAWATRQVIVRALLDLPNWIRLKCFSLQRDIAKCLDDQDKIANHSKRLWNLDSESNPELERIPRNTLKPLIPWFLRNCAEVNFQEPNFLLIKTIQIVWDV